MEFKHSYIELPVPSEGWKKISSYFDRPNNPDNLGFVRCKTCYTRFPPNFDVQSRLDHLKTHNSKWHEYVRRVEESLNHDYNHTRIIYGDERERDDLKLSHGIHFQDENLVIRFPKSRTRHSRYSSNRWRKNDRSWNKKVADEYQNNHIGGFQGNFDKPICEKKIRCGNSFLSFSEFVNYRHEPTTACKLFGVNSNKYNDLENKDKIKAYFITKKVENQTIVGPATEMENNGVIYTCGNHKCVFPCICKACVLGIEECQEHKILHPHLFEFSEDFFTVRNADSFNITCNTGIIRYSNSMVKGQEMVYDVYKYAGIKRDCLSCSDDIFHHQSFHFIYHESCKFCRASRHRIEGVLTNKQFLTRFENRRFEELVSCHYCHKIFSSVQYKNEHVRNAHEQKDEAEFSVINVARNLIHKKTCLFT